MRQIVRLAPFFRSANQLLRSRVADQLHPLHFWRAEITDQLLRAASAAAQLVVTQVHDDCAEPSAKRHLRSIRGERRERPEQALLRQVTRDLTVGEKSLAKP